MLDKIRNNKHLTTLLVVSIIIALSLLMIAIEEAGRVIRRIILCNTAEKCPMIKEDGKVKELVIDTTDLVKALRKYKEDINAITTIVATCIKEQGKEGEG